jgi:hypothetical protein
MSPRDKPTSNPDGSLTLYAQKPPPGKGKEANGLPTPKGAFMPMSQRHWRHWPSNTTPSTLQSSGTPPAPTQGT